jgi:hypothetical protein
MSDFAIQRAKEHLDSFKQSNVLYDITEDSLKKRQEQQTKEANEILIQEDQYIEKLYTKCIKLCDKAAKRGEYSCYIALIKSNFVDNWIIIKSHYDDFEWICIKNESRYECRLIERLQQEGLDVSVNSYSKLKSAGMRISWRKT